MTTAANRTSTRNVGYTLTNGMGIRPDIQSGAFAKRFIDDQNSGRKEFEAFRKQDREHKIEKVGAELRAAMPFLDPVKVVNGTVVKA